MTLQSGSSASIKWTIYRVLGSARAELDFAAVLQAVPPRRVRETPPDIHDDEGCFDGHCRSLDNHQDGQTTVRRSAIPRSGIPRTRVRTQGDLATRFSAGLAPDGSGPVRLHQLLGVLHHLTDPPQGLAALKSILKDNGAIEIMLYGQYGRTSVSQMQELMRLGESRRNGFLHLRAEYPQHDRRSALFELVQAIWWLVVADKRSSQQRGNLRHVYARARLSLHGTATLRVGGKHRLAPG